MCILYISLYISPLIFVVLAEYAIEVSVMISARFTCEMQLVNFWGRVTHICVSKLTIIGSDNGLSPDRRQAIIWTNAGLLFIGPLGTNSEILIEILTSSFKNMHLKVPSAKRRIFCLGLSVLIKILLPRSNSVTTEYHAWTVHILLGK